MIDIHCHPLYETDDGAKSFDIAVEMLKMAAADGITHLVATPHCNFSYPYDPSSNREKAAKLQAAVGESPQLMLGCDFHLSYENIRRLTDKTDEFGVNGSQYVLVEFDDHFIPDLMDNVFYEIQLAGFTPILTHPERNAVCRHKLGSVYNWVTRGCLVQVTAQSFTGGFGSEAQQAVERLLDHDMVHVMASDAHDTRHRPPILSRAYGKLAEERGEDLADLLFVGNPGAIIDGKPLPPGPQPSSPEARKSKKWWSFLKR
ncbi:MAG: exopolysaccharide biosynthesis protein [Acidobacteriota bacterium]|nr:exopolysaccharide biosynthesis protein [Acidobacteriota bacterium]